MTGTPFVVSRMTVLAYERTDYRIDYGSGAFVLHIGEPSDAVRALHRSFGVSCSVFVTACNPFGQRRSEGDNARAMQRLRDRLVARGIRWIAGEGRGTEGSWTPEPSVLAFGLDTADAAALCLEFDQNAAVAIGEDATPRLVFHPRAVVHRR